MVAEHGKISQQILMKVNTGTLGTITFHPYLHLTLVALEVKRSYREGHIQLNLEENKGIGREGASRPLRPLDSFSLNDSVSFKHQLRLSLNADTNPKPGDEERRISL